MIRQKLDDTSYGVVTWYIYNKPDDPLIDIRCGYDGSKLCEVKGKIIRITNEDTPLGLMISNNQSYISAKCHMCKTLYKLLIYNYNE